MTSKRYLYTHRSLYPTVSVMKYDCIRTYRLNKRIAILTRINLDATTWWVHEDHALDALLHLRWRVDGAERSDIVRVRLVGARSCVTQQEGYNFRRYTCVYVYMDIMVIQGHHTPYKCIL